MMQKYGLSGDYFLYLGGFDWRKDVATLLRAFVGLLNSIPPDGSPQLHLVVAGRLPDDDTDFTPNPIRIAHGLGLGERVVFTGWVPEEEKPALYAGAKAFVFPSRYEGFGLPPLEAMACGTPVIASNTSSLPEVVGPGGLLVPPGDVTALTEAMVGLWTQPGLRHTLSQRAKRHASRFSWTQTARATLAAYARLAAAHGND
jgi:glycosyltransferase involved in cell wall biosynthesis